MSKKSKRQWVNDMAYEALVILKENDGSLSLSRLLLAVKERTGEKIPEDQFQRIENNKNSNRLKWEVSLQFACNKFVTAGFLNKDKGVWRLTSAGLMALEKGAVHVQKTADVMETEYLRKKREAAALEAKLLEKRDNTHSGTFEIPSAIPFAKSEQDDESEEDEDEHFSDSLEGDEQKARDNIEKHIRDLTEYQFQDLCAALLRGMGYHVRDVSLPGPDGGIDVLAYADPIGSKPPRIKLQAKHLSTSKVSTNVITKLAHILTEGDIGIVATSSSFASGCRDFARGHREHHIELIDLNRFIDLWREIYGKLSEEDKDLLPLRPIYFIDKERVKKS